MINRVVLVGRMTRDPELRRTPQGDAVTSFTLAVNRNFTSRDGQQQADFINCVVWRKPAENVERYCSKGSLVGVEGRIQTRNYDDKDGKKVYVTEILASNISFLDSKGTGATGNTSFNNLPEPPMVDTSSNNMETVSVEKDPFEAFGDSIEISDNDLPF